VRHEQDPKDVTKPAGRTAADAGLETLKWSRNHSIKFSYLLNMHESWEVRHGTTPIVATANAASSAHPRHH